MGVLRRLGCNLSGEHCGPCLVCQKIVVAGSLGIALGDARGSLRGAAAGRRTALLARLGFDRRRRLVAPMRGDAPVDLLLPRRKESCLAG